MLKNIPVLKIYFVDIIQYFLRPYRSDLLLDGSAYYPFEDEACLNVI